ncbi:MAG: hypothetical protein HY976_03095 [Candidatus Kerfeldbacteria bacterium]|nr:hypothetical protein [Candidatus Kerfeldbacteria bacterium]
MNRSDFPSAWYTDVLERAQADSGVAMSANFADSEVVARLVVYNDRLHAMCFCLRLDPRARESVEAKLQHRFLVHWQDALDGQGRPWRVIHVQVNEGLHAALEHLFKNFLGIRDLIFQAHRAPA